MLNLVKTLLPFAALFVSYSLPGQGGAGIRFLKPQSGTVCYSSPRNAGTLVPEPKNFSSMKASGAKTQAATIQVTYIGFSDEARASFEAAVEVWEALISSPVTIRVEAEWAPLGPSILGGASPGTYVANFDGAPRTDVWYPIGLAEKIAGKELNSPGSPDIRATFNSQRSNWHFGTNGDGPPAGKYDLMTVVLHEIGHGLGITHSYEVSGSNGVIASAFQGRPVVYETFIENGAGSNLVTQFSEPSPELRTQLIGQNLFFDSKLVLEANTGERARLYAPSTYDAGSSVAHLNETTYLAGSANSMMTPQLEMQERVLDPGPIVMGILHDMGWLHTRIDHEPLKSVESVAGALTVKAKIVSDNGYNASSVKLKYTVGSEPAVEVAMTPTANANEFEGTLPSGNGTYKYFISVADAAARVFTEPGVRYDQGAALVQTQHEFIIGPDTKAPFISHVPVGFITTNDPLEVSAVVSDNLGVDEVTMDWQINNADQPPVQLELVPDTDSTYAATVSFTGTPLNVGDVIKYRIRAKDVAVAGNVRAVPSASGFFTVNVAGLAAAKTAYVNNFNSPSAADDFFGTGFSVATPAGFDNGAVHTVHPYPEGFDAPGEQRNLYFQLKNPIIVQELNAMIRFDEIVLVEPGEPNSVFGQTDFYDFVVVEGSTDGGVTWSAIADGYDSRADQTWLNSYNANISANISTTAGTPSMYRPREINMRPKYSPGEEVAIRFRLFSDPHAAGWGWAIDNLRIQIDEIAPSVVHQHVDHVMAGTANLDIDAEIKDDFGLLSVSIDYSKAGQTAINAPLIVDPARDAYSFDLPLSTLNVSAGDEVQYRIRTTDTNGNERVVPSLGFFKVAVLAMSPSSDSYTQDFNATTTDFSGNFFGFQQPSGFTNGAVHTSHPYTANGVGNTDFTFVLKKPIKISATNPFISFDEIVVAENDFVTFKDYVIVEGSLDGKAWEKLVEPYSSNVVGTWRVLYETNGVPTLSHYVNRVIKLTATGKFKANDVILIRFRLFSDKATTGWGWSVDNLSVQGPVTGVESLEQPVVYPNPAHDVVNLDMYLPHATDVAVSFISLQGQVYQRETFQAPAGKLQRELSIAGLPRGLFVLKVDAGESSLVRKIMRE